VTGERAAPNSNHIAGGTFPCAIFTRLNVAPVLTPSSIGDIPVAKPNLSKMDFESLVNLRQQVEERLHEYRATLEKQLEALGSSIASIGSKIGRGGRSALKGKKVAPKYRSPDGETWAGRGATPRWLKAAIKEGKKLESFLIDKSAADGRKKRAKKA
jgi:DNA-binding protein H-NS